MVVFGVQHGVVSGQVFALFVIAVAAAEVGVGLAIVLLLYRNRTSIDVEDFDLITLLLPNSLSPTLLLIYSQNSVDACSL